MKICCCTGSPIPDCGRLSVFSIFLRQCRSSYRDVINWSTVFPCSASSGMLLLLAPRTSIREADQNDLSARPQGDERLRTKLAVIFISRDVAYKTPSFSPRHPSPPPDDTRSDQCRERMHGGRLDRF